MHNLYFLFLDDERGILESSIGDKISKISPICSSEFEDFSDKYYDAFTIKLKLKTDIPPDIGSTYNFQLQSKVRIHSYVNYVDNDTSKDYINL